MAAVRVTATVRRQGNGAQDAQKGTEKADEAHWHQPPSI